MRAVVDALVGDDLALEHDLGVGRHEQVVGLALDELDRAARPGAGGVVLHQAVLVGGDRGAGREGQQWVHAHDDGAGGRQALGLVFEDVGRAVAVADAAVAGAQGRVGADFPVALDLYGRGVLVDDHGAVLPHVEVAVLRVAGNEAGGGADVAAAVLLVPFGRWERIEVHVLAHDLDLLHGPRGDLRGGEALLHALLDDVAKLLPVRRAVQRYGELVLAVHDVGGQRHPGVVLDVLEEESGAVADEVPVADGAQLRVQVDLGGDALEHASVFQQLDVAAHVVVLDAIALAGSHEPPPMVWVGGV